MNRPPPSAPRWEPAGPLPLPSPRTLASVLLLLTLLATQGCAQRYAVTLSNSDVLYTRTKPQLNERGVYVFQDSEGRECQVNALRVRQIERR